MTIEQVIQLYFDRSDAFHILWSLYISVSFGLLAFVSAVPRVCKHNLTRVVLAVALVAFALGNLNSLNLIRIQRENLTKVAQARVTKLDDSGSRDELQEVVRAGKPPSSAALFGFHLAMDMGIVGFLWIIPRYARRDAAH